MRDENSLALKKSIICQKRLLECKNVIEISTIEVVSCRINNLSDRLFNLLNFITIY